MLCRDVRFAKKLMYQVRNEKDMHKKDGGVPWYKLQQEKNRTKLLKFPSRDFGSKNEHGLEIAFERDPLCEGEGGSLVYKRACRRSHRPHGQRVGLETSEDGGLKIKVPMVTVRGPKTSEILPFQFAKARQEN